MNTKLTLLAMTALVASFASAQRAPTVSYTVTGSAGAWDLNFSITNNFNAGEGLLYFFGVDAPTGRNIQASPNNWDSEFWTDWDNSTYGGSSIHYNNNWIVQNSANDLPEGSSASGFVVRTTDATAPSFMAYFVYAESGSYQGTDHFNSASNPGFEGIAFANTVPEPTSIVVLSLGALALIRRRKIR